MFFLGFIVGVIAGAVLVIALAAYALSRSDQETSP